MPIESLMIVGGGGHARVVLDALRSRMPDLPVTVFDDNAALDGSACLDCTISTPIVWDPKRFAHYHVAIGNNAFRRSLQHNGQAKNIQPWTIQHLHSTVSPEAQLGEGIFVGAGAIVAPGVRVGAGAIINHGAIIDHDCAIGDFSHLAPRSVLGGGVRVGLGVLIGAGAVILPGRKIGNHAIVGAGAVVTRDIDDHQTVVGIPARLLSGK